jgi:hypothetical protein
MDRTAPPLGGNSLSPDLSTDVTTGPGLQSFTVLETLAILRRVPPASY